MNYVEHDPPLVSVLNTNSISISDRAMIQRLRFELEHAKNTIAFLQASLEAKEAEAAGEVCCSAPSVSDALSTALRFPTTPDTFGR